MDDRRLDLALLLIALGVIATVALISTAVHVFVLHAPFSGGPPPEYPCCTDK